MQKLRKAIAAQTRHVLTLLAMLTSLPAPAAEVLAGPIPATVVDVIDGDTITVRARIWLGQAIETRVRLAGIDTPEIRGDCPAERELALRARDRLAETLSEGPVTLTEIRYGTYAGRVVARVSTTDTPDIAGTLVTAGLARPYGGRGARPDWCGRLGNSPPSAAEPGPALTVRRH